MAGVSRLFPCSLALFALATTARAEPPMVPQWGAPDGEDHHQRPPGWDDYAIPEPPPFYIAPEYPRAVAFVPANPGNYAVGGIVSYDYVVVHTMQGSYGGTISWFQNPDAVVSAHYVMRASDGEVTQMVLDENKAYHVGTSNKYALGIEHEGFVAEPDKYYTWATYSSSALLSRWLTIEHAIPVDRTHILGHVELPSQSHTDPGDGWNWDLYMALIKEVVPPSQIVGVAVDRSKPCTLTATAATVIKRTAMRTDLQPPADLCSVAAGTKLDYWHARRDIDGHHRLYMPPGEGPCAGMNGLDEDAYILAAQWSALCPDAAMAAVGAVLQVDGGAQATADASGGFSFNAAPGGHTIDALPGAFEASSEAVELAGYPGARVVVALDPVEAPDPTGDPTSDTSDPGDTNPTTDPTADPTADPSDPTADSGDPTAPVTTVGETGDDEPGQPTTGGPATGEAGGEPTSDSFQTTLTTLPNPALPDGYGQDDETGCACRTHAAPPSGLLLLGLLALLRRRRTCPRGQPVRV